MASMADWRRIMRDGLRDPGDVEKALIALEEVCYEAAGEVESMWAGSGTPGRAGKPWQEMGKIVGRAQVSVDKSLKRWWGKV
jgi:hypothetical protein